MVCTLSRVLQLSEATMKCSRLYLAISILGFALLLPAQAQESVGVISKSKGQTYHKKFNADDYMPKANIGSKIMNHDWVKTGKNGYIALFFLDDKSQLKIRENSEMEVLGAVDQGRINKTITMEYGTVKAKVDKQLGEFRIATPTSVASVKGTEFWVISGPNGDQFIGLSGTVQIQNRSSGQTTTVTQDQTATSTSDGNIDVTVTVDTDVPDDPDVPETTGENQNTGTGNLHELRIHVTDDNNQERTIVIEYSD